MTTKRLGSALVALALFSMLLMPLTEAARRTVTMRVSAATSGAAEQDAEVRLAGSPTELWLVVDKTAEANADNILTVRLQCKVGPFWVDVPYTSTTISGVLTVAADVTADVTQQTNAVDVYTALAVARFVTHYKDLPCNTVRTISISSGTGAANTFSAIAVYR